MRNFPVSVLFVAFWVIFRRSVGQGSMRRRLWLLGSGSLLIHHGIVHNSMVGNRVGQWAGSDRVSGRRCRVRNE
jgi:hypothetical protein